MSGRRPDQPVRLATTHQRWESIAFLHWAYPAADVAALLPPGLVPDTVEGAAWVGVTPFLMRDARPPGVPAAPRWSRFAEVNVRTYVRHPASGTDGLWFLALLCPRRTVVAGLRAVGLPYHRAAGAAHDGPDGVSYRLRAGGGELLRARVVPGARVLDPDPWHVSVTGRWGAYTRRAGRLWRVPVEHAPWPLHAAEAPDLATDLLERCGLPSPAGPARVSWSPGVDVRIGLPHPMPSGSG